MPETSTAKAKLPPGIRTRFVDNSNGLSMHVLEAGWQTPGRPVLLLLHGFPELAYSWRKVMEPLADAGYHVIAPDQRGYGATTGWDDAYDGDLAAFRVLNLVRDVVGLTAALGIRRVDAIVGHDFGSYVAAWCALLRGDLFRSVALMSAPFAGPPSIPFATAETAAGKALRGPSALDAINDALGRITPPRKHYHWYYGTRAANPDMMNGRQGLHAFLRAYYHYKSGDWKPNQPFPLKAWTAEDLAQLPTYYVMERDKGMAETVAPFLPSAAEIAACRWLADDELAVYTGAYQRTGFQGGLNWYRCRNVAAFTAELETFSGRTIDIPACFIAGAKDWGIHQAPGALDQMQTKACSRFVSCDLVADAGHWVQQEQPEAVCRLLLGFLGQVG